MKCHNSNNPLLKLELFPYIAIAAVLMIEMHKNVVNQWLKNSVRIMMCRIQQPLAIEIIGSPVRG